MKRIKEQQGNIWEEKQGLITMWAKQGIGLARQALALVNQLYKEFQEHVKNTHASAPGKSAYEIAVQNGFVGTQAEWLNSLKGEPGQNGEDGSNGTDGVDGSDGQNGANGQNGKSAYQLAQENGFTGTLTQWLASLKGETGTNGTNGTNGSNGSNGSNGTNGKSAYELAVQNGYSGTLTQWLASLKGVDGTNGTNGSNGASWNPGTPVVMPVTIGTARQAMDTSKPACIYINVEVTYALTAILLTANDELELRIHNASTGLSDGSAGIAIARFKVGLTGTIGLGQRQSDSLFAHLPAGWYFIVRRVAGTLATIGSAFSQPST